MLSVRLAVLEVRLGPVAVELDLMNPTRPLRGMRTQRGEARRPSSMPCLRRNLLAGAHNRLVAGSSPPEFPVSAKHLDFPNFAGARRAHPAESARLVSRPVKGKPHDENLAISPSSRCVRRRSVALAQRIRATIVDAAP